MGMGASCSKFSLCYCWWGPRSKSSKYCHKPLGESGVSVPAFCEYSLDDLKAAIDGFSPNRIVSEHSEKTPMPYYAVRFLRSAVWLPSSEKVSERRMIKRRVEGYNGQIM
ncbi:hypothetical protein FCM35_KLT17179 [Carex littledalei]|uniref:Uncharacterized protein n=1 Tax=Carex littledalei TaxID=544730 RepID=A0A833RBH0_9POAL|nr:hypothetical protein FCM35_KLT17179 [Carex littledalei]